MAPAHLEKRKEARKAAEKAAAAAPSGAAAGSRARPSHGRARAERAAGGPLRAPWRGRAGHDRPPASPQRGGRPDRGRPARGLPALRGRRGGARAGADGRRRRLLLRGRGPEGDRDDGRTADERRGADGLHPPDSVQADDRRDLRLLPGGRAGARAVVRSADRDGGLHARLPGAPLGRAADRRRHAATAPHRRPRPGARPDPHGTRSSTRRRRCRWGC